MCFGVVMTVRRPYAENQIRNAVSHLSAAHPFLNAPLGYGEKRNAHSYRDVIFTPEGDVKIDDRDELDRAYCSGELMKAQYDAALTECGLILRRYWGNIRSIDEWCASVRQLVEDRIAQGEPIKLCREKRIRTK